MKSLLWCSSQGWPHGRLDAPRNWSEISADVCSKDENVSACKLKSILGIQSHLLNPIARGSHTGFYLFSFYSWTSSYHTYYIHYISLKSYVSTISKLFTVTGCFPFVLHSPNSVSTIPNWWHLLGSEKTSSGNLFVKWLLDTLIAQHVFLSSSKIAKRSPPSKKVAKLAQVRISYETSETWNFRKWPRKIL